MCLIINCTYHPQIGFNVPDALKANEDILVYKLLFYLKNKEYITSVRGYSIKFKFNKFVYNTRLRTKYLYSIFGSLVGYSVQDGLHAYIKSPVKISSEFHYAIIPKGSHFYIGENNDIVSDQLIIYKRKPWWFIFKKPISVDNYIEKYIQK